MLNNASKLTKTYSLTDITFSGVGHIIGAEYLLYFHLLSNMPKAIHGWLSL